MKRSGNRKLAESFWIRCVSKQLFVKEVRWDLFEEAVVSYVKDFLVINSNAIKRLNWSKLLFALK